MRRLPPPTLAALVVLAVACAAPSSQTVESRGPRLESAELGDMRNVMVCDGVWMGGRPTPSDLDLARRRGVERVIDLGTPMERIGRRLPQVCDDLGLEYVAIDVAESGDGPGGELSSESVDQALAALRTPARGTLLVDEDGTRCATVFAIHRVVQGGVELDDALGEARAAGLDRDRAAFVREQVRRLEPAG